MLISLPPLFPDYLEYMKCIVPDQSTQPSQPSKTGLGVYELPRIEGVVHA